MAQMSLWCDLTCSHALYTHLQIFRTKNCFYISIFSLRIEILTLPCCLVLANAHDCLLYLENSINRRFLIVLYLWAQYANDACLTKRNLWEKAFYSFAILQSPCSQCAMKRRKIIKACMPVPQLDIVLVDSCWRRTFHGLFHPAHFHQDLGSLLYVWSVEVVVYS